MRSLRWRFVAIPLLVALGLAAGSGAGAAVKVDGGQPTPPPGAHVVQNGSEGGGYPNAGSGGGGITPDLVPANWCSASYSAWDTTGPDTANVESAGSCNGPIAGIWADSTLFGDNGQNNLADNDTYTPNTSWDAAVATDYCDGDPGGCYGDNPMSDYVGNTFWTNQGWSGSLNGCTTGGDYMYCNFWPGSWNWP